MVRKGFELHYFFFRFKKNKEYCKKRLEPDDEIDFRLKAIGESFIETFSDEKPFH